jgi:hypothetical protein
VKVRVEFIRLAFEPAGKVDTQTLECRDVQDALNRAWEMWNRGSGREVIFAGPSASVGDLFRVVVNGDERLPEMWAVQGYGFSKIQWSGSMDFRPAGQL